MGFRKTLSLITIFVLSMFILMLSSSYAWYSFSNASTTFNTKTSDDDINVMYKSSRFISTVTAVPINKDDVLELAEKNNFSIDVSNDKLEEALSVSIRLTSIEIDSALKNDSFRYDLIYNGNNVSSGSFDNFSGSVLNLIDGIILNNLSSNDFELRIYLLDDGTNQNNLMNKTFKGIISVNVVSRVNVTLDNQDIDFFVKKIIIDGKDSDYLPSSGRYTMESLCDKGSNIKWDSLTRSLIFASGSVINDRCSLTFKSSSFYELLSDVVKVGDYVRYVGNNGCVGSACEGVNVNYVDDTNMGYCSNFNNKYITSGWRVLYVLDGSTYISSGGALECSNVLENDNLDNLSLKYCNSNFVYNNRCDSDSVRSINGDDFNRIVNSSLSDCYDSKSNKSCGYNDSLIDNGGYYWFNGGKIFNWNPSSRSIGTSGLDVYMGLRPVIRLNDKVNVVSGMGTYDDPYIIK